MPEALMVLHQCGGHVAILQPARAHKSEKSFGIVRDSDHVA